MNKKMREILKTIEEKTIIAKNYQTEKDFDKANGVLNEIEELQKEYEVESKLFNMSKEEVTDEKLKEVKEEKKASGFAAVTKMVTGRKINTEEKALIIEADPSADNANGTNYLLPEDVQLTIRELRRNYKSAKDLGLVNVVPTTAVSGSTNFETDDDGLLTDFDDGDAISEETGPKFKNVPFTIKFKGKLIYISNIVSGNEKAGLTNYLNKWFVKKAVRTENVDIFNTLKKGKTAVAITGLNALKEHINKNLDPACAETGVIITNQTGFAEMDKQKDRNGRGLLEVDPTNKSRKMFQNMPIHVFSDKELKPVNGKAPMFVGATDAGCDFMDKDGIEFATSEHYAFNKNQNTLRVIEGYDTVQTDANAYSYITYTGVDCEESTTIVIEKEAETNNEQTV
ncbi:MAG: phage major capsid protein [Bacilli bacterium]